MTHHAKSLYLSNKAKKSVYQKNELHGFDMKPSICYAVTVACNISLLKSAMHEVYLIIFILNLNISVIPYNQMYCSTCYAKLVVSTECYFTSCTLFNVIVHVVDNKYKISNFSSFS